MQLASTVSRRTAVALWGAAVLAALSPGLAQAGEKPTTHVVEIQQFAFVPATLTIKPGDRVEWVNRDFVPHTATERDAAWDSGTLAKTETVVIQFDDAGTQAYFCMFHPHMRSEIVVRAAGTQD